MSESYQVKVRPEKVEAVEAIRAEFEGAAAAVITEYRGLTVEELKTLRAQLHDLDTTYRVTKKTLARRATSELGLDLESVLEGPIAVAYVKGDPVSAAKVIANFAKEHPNLVIKAGVLDGKILSDTETKDLATVDPLDVSRAKIAGLLTAPLQQLMMLLEAPAGRILFVLDQLGKREDGSPQPEASAPSDEEQAAPQEQPEAGQEEQPEQSTEGEGE